MTNADLVSAAAQSRAAIARGVGDAYDLAIVALAHSANGEFREADTLFARALALEPGNPSTLTSLAIHYRRQGRYRDALRACDEAIRLYPDYPDAWIEHGAILVAGGSTDAARASFLRALTLTPGHSAANAALAGLAARDGQWTAARSYANAALAHDPSNAVAINALANAEFGEGDLAKAEALLNRQVSQLHEPSVERSFAFSLLGDISHRRQDSSSAYRHYLASKADFAALHPPAALTRPDQRSLVEAISEGLATTNPPPESGKSFARSVGAATRHVFLLGYPRSGTTLVENALASLPGVAALEERPTLAAVDRDCLVGDAAAIAAAVRRFGCLDDTALQPYRDAYWAGVTASGVPADAPCFVDMDPFKGTHLPFIARLFPEARVLLMRRDPRDVVWSCFRTNFAMFSQTLEYTTLERTARHYDALMRLMEMALQRLPLAVHVVDYHRLVRDFDAETQAICAFVGLEWSEAVRSFDRTAVQRGVSTASVGQVRRGLYDGTRQWEPYAEYLEPVMPLLAPWIAKFGYPA